MSRLSLVDVPSIEEVLAVAGDAPIIKLEKAKQKVYKAAYRQRPEVKARSAAYYQRHKDELKARMAAYSQRPEVKAKHTAYMVAYYQRHAKELKARSAAYSQRPEVKAKHTAYMVAYYQRPEVKAKKAARDMLSLSEKRRIIKAHHTGVAT